MMTNPLQQLGEAGQSVWLDFIDRKILESGGLKRLVEDDGVKGVTSNPSIFEKAIGDSGDYDDRLGAFLSTADAEVIDVFEHLAIADIQEAADLLRPVYDAGNGADGFVSLEVSPYLALDTEQTVAEARRLWRAVDRPNLMVKVPGTQAGVPAIRTLISEGININVTLLFAIDAYLAVAEAHVAGLEALKANGGDVSRIAGVASFFVSRIDSQIDKAIDKRVSEGDPESAALKALRGKVAIANAKIAYQEYRKLIASPRWRVLASAGARPQRLLWASTGTKDPAYPDVLYVETLIGPDTVNTMPPKTLDAFRDHGKAAQTLTQDVEAAARILAETARLGLDLPGVTGALVTDGVRQFSDAADKLLSVVAGKRTQVLGERLNRQHLTLPTDLQDEVDKVLEKATAEGWARRLWAHDASLWTGADEGKWLGWLGAARGEGVDLEALEAFQAEVSAAGFIHALLLGMGGSSLGPEVLAETFGTRPDHPKLLVLDSTDPHQIRRFEAQIDPARTLFIVASKSGSTLEPDILHRHFYEAACKAVGPERAGGQFVAITDPGSKLEAVAREQGFRRVFLGDPAIGGRYSVLSNFGMVPAAIIGLDLKRFHEAVMTMVRSCGPSAPPAANPGFVLGAAMGACARAGRDKVTVIASRGIADIGAWLEQLIAESTGKLGRGLIPVDAEPLGPPVVYGDDRLFAYLRLEGIDQPEADAAVRDLEEAGHPVVRISISGRDLIGQEFFRWEVATAVAGAVIGINPFDQPDVEAAKVAARKLMEEFEKTGRLAPETPILEEHGLRLFADPQNAAALAQAAGTRALDAYLGAHFSRAGSGDYLALLAYIDRDRSNIEALEGVRKRLRDRLKVATAVGFGPRFLHSTGQAYKGGPNSGVFLQITHAPAEDLPVPGSTYGFAAVEQAQARGDLDVLAERGRRLLRVDLGADVAGGLKRLVQAIDASLP